MGCIQSYFKRASLRSAQHSPEEQDKKFAESNAAILAAGNSNEEKKQQKKAPIVSEETSPADEEEDDEDAGSLGTSQSIPLIDANAVKTLAASTGTVAILGTTAKCNENASTTITTSTSIITTNTTAVKSDGIVDEEGNPSAKIRCAVTYDRNVSYGEETAQNTVQQTSRHSHRQSIGGANIITTKAVIETRPIDADSSSSTSPKKTDDNVTANKPALSMEFGEIEKKTFVKDAKKSDSDKPASTRNKVPDTLEIIPIVDLQSSSNNSNNATRPKSVLTDRKYDDGIEQSLKASDDAVENTFKDNKTKSIVKSLVTHSESISPPIRDTTLLPSQWQVATTKVPTADGGFTLVETVLTTEEEIRKHNERREKEVAEIAKTLLDTQYEIRRELYEMEKKKELGLDYDGSFDDEEDENSETNNTISPSVEQVSEPPVVVKKEPAVVSVDEEKIRPIIVTEKESEKLINNKKDNSSDGKLPVIVSESVKKESPNLTESDRTSDSEEKDSTSNDVVSVISEIKEARRVESVPVEKETVPSLDNKLVDTKEPSFEVESDNNNNIDEKFTKENQSPSPAEDGVKEISSTSLNTLGEDDSQISDLEADVPKKTSTTAERSSALRRFDTISSNGETSYNESPVQEENLSSLAEELSEQLELLELEHLAKEKYETDENIAASRKFATPPDNLPDIIETVREEVDRICERAVEKTTAYLNQREKRQQLKEDLLNLEDGGNNVSECSGLSTVDSVLAEKGSDFDSLSYLDEQSDSRPLSSVSVEKPDDKVEYGGRKLEYAQEILTDQEDDISFTALPDVQPPSLVQEDLSSADTEKTAVDSVSDDLPKPPELDELPLPPDNVDQFDIAEEDIKSVRLPPQSEDDEKALANAAIKIQAGVRGYLTRKQIKGSADDDKKSNRYEYESVDGNDDDANGATTNDFKDRMKGKRLSLDSKLGDYESIRKHSVLLRSTLSECKEDEAEYGNNNGESRLSKGLDPNEAAKKIQNTFRHYRAGKNNGLSDGSPQLLNGRAQLLNKLDDNSETTDSRQVVQRTIKQPNGSVTTVALTPNGLEKSADNSGKFGYADDENVKFTTTAAAAKLDNLPQPAVIETVNGQGKNWDDANITRSPSTTNDSKKETTTIIAEKKQDDDNDEEEEAAAKKIQAVFRAKKTNRQRQSIQLTSAAATKIQAGFRGYKVRKELKKSNSVGDLRKRNNSCCSSGSIASMNLEDKCAAKIQAGIRGYLVRKRHSLQNNAAVKIQTNYRKYKTRKEQDKPSKIIKQKIDDDHYN